MGVLGCTFFNLTDDCDKHPECARLTKEEIAPDKHLVMMYQTELDIRTFENGNATAFHRGGAIMAPDPMFDEVAKPYGPTGWFPQPPNASNTSNATNTSMMSYSIRTLSAGVPLTQLKGKGKWARASARSSHMVAAGAVTQQLGSGAIQGVTRAQEQWAAKKGFGSVVASKSCNLKPGMVYNRKSFKIREWFLKTANGAKSQQACCMKCRTTENCAFFNVGPPAGHCYLMKIQAKEGASKKATLKKKGGWTGGSIVDFNAVGAAGAGAANPTPEPKSEECDHCPKKCWEHMRKWLLATAFGGTLLGLVATAIIIKEFLPEDGDISLVDGTLWSCFTLTSLTEVSFLGVKLALAGALLGWHVLGSAYTWEPECRRLCYTTLLWQALHRYMVAVIIIGLLTFIVLVAMLVLGAKIISALGAETAVVELMHNTVQLMPPLDDKKYKPVSVAPAPPPYFPGFIAQPAKLTKNPHCSLDYCPWEGNTTTALLRDPVSEQVSQPRRMTQRWNDDGPPLPPPPFNPAAARPLHSAATFEQNLRNRL